MAAQSIFTSDTAAPLAVAFRAFATQVRVTECIIETAARRSSSLRVLASPTPPTTTKAHGWPYGRREAASSRATRPYANEYRTRIPHTHAA